MISPVISLACITAFILAVRLMSSPHSAVTGSYIGIGGMILAIIFAFGQLPEFPLFPLLALMAGAGIGYLCGIKIKITSLPQMIAAFNGLGGGAAVCISAGEFLELKNISIALPLGAVIGAVTFSGSTIAFCKLQGLISGKPQHIPALSVLNLLFAATVAALVFYTCFSPQRYTFCFLILMALLWGVWLVWPIGGADMPIIISVLNAFSGWASVAVGFAQSNVLMIAVGAIVGASGSILAYIMTKAMNVSLADIFRSHGPTSVFDNTETSRTARSGSPSDAAFIMQNAQKVIIVPGFGMAAAAAQHAVKVMGDLLHGKYNVEVKYAIHPVAGRMPGHMNVLLAEANVNYDDVYELEDINREFASADVAYVIGANDITNPEAKNNPDSPLYGMPILDVEAAKTVFFVKRSLGSGYSGTDNPLFFAPNTIMLYGDAKKITEEIDKALEQ